MSGYDEARRIVKTYVNDPGVRKRVEAEIGRAEAVDDAKRLVEEPDEIDRLTQVQLEVGAWARQFGANRSQWTGDVLGSLAPLLGMVEEIGEIVGATVKRHQGRGFKTDEEYLPAIQDGVADLLVFASDYANREGFSLIEVLEKVWSKVKNRSQKTWTEDKAVEIDPLLPLPKPLSFYDSREQTGAGFAEPPEEGEAERFENTDMEHFVPKERIQEK